MLDATQASNSGRVISFDDAQVVPGIVNGTYFLIVSGQAPCMNMQVALVPRIYVRCPEFWEIEVVGTLPGGFCLTAIRPYSVTIPLTGIIGSIGVEVVGANRSEQFKVPGGCS
jgi:hypothetical protein